LIKNILNFLNENSGAFSVLFAFLVAGATIVYAILTRSLVKETKRLRKAQTEPNVCTYVQIMPGLYSFSAFVIENIGMGPAHDVQFNLENDYIIFKQDKVSEIEVFKQGISYLAPGQKVIPFMFFTETKNAQPQPPLKIAVSFKNSVGDDFNNSFAVIMDRNIGVSDVQKADTEKMEREVRDLRSSIQSLTHAIERLKLGR